VAIIPTSRTGSSRSKALLLEVPDLREQPTEIAPLDHPATDATSAESAATVAAPIDAPVASTYQSAKAEVLKYTTIADSPAMVAFEWPALEDAADAPLPSTAAEAPSADFEAPPAAAESLIETAVAECRAPEALQMETLPTETLQTEADAPAVAESLADDCAGPEESSLEPAAKNPAAELSVEPASQTVEEPAPTAEVRQAVTDSIIAEMAKPSSSVAAGAVHLPVSEKPASSATMTAVSESPASELSDKTCDEQGCESEADRNRPSSVVASLLRRPDPLLLRLHRRASSLRILALRGQIWIGQHRHSRRFWLGTASLVLIALSCSAMLVGSFRNGPEHLEFNDGDSFAHTPPGAMQVEEVAPENSRPVPATGTAPADSLTLPAATLPAADAGKAVEAAVPTSTIQTASYETASPSTPRGAWLTGTIESDP